MKHLMFHSFDVIHVSDHRMPWVPWLADWMSMFIGRGSWRRLWRFHTIAGESKWRDGCCYHVCITAVTCMKYLCEFGI